MLLLNLLWLGGMWNQTWRSIVESNKGTMVVSMNKLGTHLFALNDRTKLKADTFECRTIWHQGRFDIVHVCIIPIGPSARIPSLLSIHFSYDLTNIDAFRMHSWQLRFLNVTIHFCLMCILVHLIWTPFLFTSFVLPMLSFYFTLSYRECNVSQGGHSPDSLDIIRPTTCTLKFLLTYIT